MGPHNPNEASGFDPSRCAQSVFASQVEPISKRKRSGKVLWHHLMRRQAAPAPPPALRRQRRAHRPRRVHRMESAHCACRLATFVVSDGVALAVAHLNVAQGNLRWGCSCGHQALLAGRLCLRRQRQDELPVPQPVLPSSSRPHSRSCTMRSYTCYRLSAACLLRSVGRPAVCVCVVARAREEGRRRLWYFSHQ